MSMRILAAGLSTCIDDKIVFSNFLLEKLDNKYILSLFNRKYEKIITKMNYDRENVAQSIAY